MEEHELIRKSRHGDMQAFEQLLCVHREHILHHCAQVTKDEVVAEDLTQEACLKAFAKIATFKEQAAFGTWLWRIAHNLCLDYLKKRQRNTAVQLQEEKTRARDIDPSILRECLERLPPKQREVFELFYVQCLAQKDIAKKLNIPYGTVRSRIYYAKRQLRKFFS